ncbi:Rhs element Vgr protein [Lewinella marina]|uniref:Type IV secretion protein Rhs n=1 Tax=Neolewinella marina TaxID=438751 RepID=A0A2G0CB46_9BACT|nr:type VI secretion system tip protein VgrG [Neolewinella marina]NJB86802.1 Rhs element Vgr protein [Neolewinella marina]PHK97186.1 type IV secretion protein Rhs [Neolewinella marina]
MNNAQTLPDDSVAGVVTFDLLTDGQAVPPTVEVLAIQVSNAANRIPFARINLRDGETETATFPLSDGDTFRPGKEIEIKVGHDGDNESIFKGKIVRQRVKVNESGASFLQLECRHPAFAMTLGRKNRYFTDVTDSDAFGTILGDYGLANAVATTTVTHRELVQYHVTDWDYLLTRAEANGLLVIAKAGLVNVVAPEIAGSPKLQLSFGGNLLAFDAELDAVHQWNEVTAQAWNPADQSLFESTATSVDFTEPGNLSGQELSEVGGLETYALRHAGFMAEDELQSWADAALLKSRLAKIRGRARFISPTVLLPGDVLELQGVGDRFNGLVFVTGVNYEVVDGACFVDAQFGLSPKWFTEDFEIATPAAGGVTAGVAGLQVATVKQLEGDPDGEDRILVTLPLVDGNGDGTWARLATLDAGQNRGWVVRPEIGDEVIVGFINDDPRDAVVLGQLHSSNKPAPIPGSDDNHEKGYTSRSEMHFTFDDDQKIVTLDTPAGNRIVLDESDTSITVEDQNGNSIVLNADGIKISSAKDIVIEAPMGKIDITATQDLGAEGLNVNIAAQAQFKAEGSAAAELSSGGSTTVKGSMVMVN